MQVLLVDLCLGTSRAVTTYLLSRLLPSKSPQVSLFSAVLTLAIDMKRGRHSRGNMTGVKPEEWFLMLLGGSMDRGCVSGTTIGFGVPGTYSPLR